MTIEQAREILHQVWTLVLPGTCLDPWLELQERIAETFREIDYAARRESALEELTHLSKLHGARRVEGMDRYIERRLGELKCQK
jgi:hypothetical protein